jgi:hypothetical protein
MNSKRQLDLKELEAWQPDGVVCPVAQLDGLSTLRVPLPAAEPATLQR